MATKRERDSPDTESTIIDGSVHSDKTESTQIVHSKRRRTGSRASSRHSARSNQSRIGSRASSARYSQQASQGNKTGTTVPYSLREDGTLRYPSSLLPKSNEVLSPLTPYSPPTRRMLRKLLENNTFQSRTLGGKKTRSTRKNNNKSKRRRT